MSAVFFVLAGVGPAAAQNYPVASTFELRDKNGNLVDSTHPVCPADGITVIASGWLANSNVKGTFHSDPVDIGTHNADASGVVRFTFTIQNVVTGLHTVRLEGTGANGSPRVIQSDVLCDCGTPGPVQSAVAGRTVDNTSRSAGTFARTGIETTTLLAIAFDLVLVGIVLVMASKRRSRTVRA